MQKVKVSIIIPVYNMEKYLEACLDSVLSQTLSGIEIVCINDGSTDSSLDILQKYEMQNKNIVVVTQKNQGAGPARNKGIDIARGEFIAFMDPDDYYPEQDVLETLYCKAIQQNVSICGGSLLQEQEGKIVYKNNELRKKNNFHENRLITYEEYQYAFAYQRFIFFRDLLKENNVYFPPYRRFQDPPFMVKAMIMAGTFYAIEKPVYVLRGIDKVVKYEKEEVVNGIARGIDDILKISSEKGLEKLHSDMLVEIFDKYINFFYKSIYLGNTELTVIMKNISDDLNDELLRKDGRFAEKPVFLDEKGICTLMQKTRDKEVALRNEIEKYPKVIIYGAGVVGRSLYEYLDKIYKGNIEFAISAHDVQGTACGQRIHSIDEYTEQIENVIVLVAVKGVQSTIMKEKAYELGFRNVVVVEYAELQLFNKEG